ncbi:MAG: endolytic transglycosylase MltG [Bacteroidales bacterium]|jgi:UPF0755 protein|nr:endolytic transglycosylase MltG [Bacteroidales bacterium]
MKNKIIIVVAVVLIGAGFAACAYRTVFSNNILPQASAFIYIQTGSSFDDVMKILKTEQILKDEHTFCWVAKQKNYIPHVKAGRYRIKQKMNNNELVNMLRSGRQEAVHFTFNNIRTKEQLVKRVADQLETDPNELLSLLNNNEKLKPHNVNTETALTLFIPNTYQMWWNTSADDFVKKMHKASQTFWTESRCEKAQKAGLSPTEVIILASIVEEENHRTNEQPRIAGVYINRLKKGMLLQADPTVKFALQDFGKKRILKKDLETESPYNTYKHVGLPPGPVRIPSPTAIDAVLDYEKHNYFYMCAKDDLSGYHNFAATLAQHHANAAKYHQALNRRKIK